MLHKWQGWQLNSRLLLTTYRGVSNKALSSKLLMVGLNGGILAFNLATERIHMIDFATSKPHNKVSKSIYFLFNSSNSRDRLSVSGLKRGKEKHHQFSFTYSQPFHSLKSWHEKNGKLKLNAPLQFADTRLMDWVCASVFPSVCLPPCATSSSYAAQSRPRAAGPGAVQFPRRRDGWAGVRRRRCHRGPGMLRSVLVERPAEGQNRPVPLQLHRAHLRKKNTLHAQQCDVRLMLILAT